MGQSERDENVNGEAISGNQQRRRKEGVESQRIEEGRRAQEVIFSACGNLNSHFLE